MSDEEPESSSDKEIEEEEDPREAQHLNLLHSLEYIVGMTNENQRHRGLPFEPDCLARHSQDRHEDAAQASEIPCVFPSNC